MCLFVLLYFLIIIVINIFFNAYQIFLKKKRPLFSVVFSFSYLIFLVKSSFSKKLATGIEPVTSSLPMRCATDCATPAFLLLVTVCYYTVSFLFCQPLFLIWKALFFQSLIACAKSTPHALKIMDL